MNPSLRNQFQGVITHVAPGISSSAVRIRINDKQTLTAIATGDQELHVGEVALAMIKASWVMIGKDEFSMAGVRNRLAGRITRISAGHINSGIILDLGQGRSICAIVSNTDTADLQEGDVACAFFKASSVVVTHQ